MKYYKNPVIYLISVAVVFLTACATPMPPGGGPGDQEGPQLLQTNPESGTTNFEGRSFEFHFNEFIERRNIRSAITVEPNFGVGYEIAWRRKSLTITFDEKLPDSTTILIKLSSEISDTHNNSLGKPITLAVSTGDEIDRGSLTGRIRQAKDGKAAEGRDVLLYRQPADLSKRANYYAQTDTSGTFEFSYLAVGRYKVILADDRNRNMIWDQGSENAFPFYREFIQLEKGGRDTLDVLYTSETDTLAPTLQGVGLFSENRMRLRFSENMTFSSDAQVVVSDSVGEDFTVAYPLYVSPNEGFVIFAHSTDPFSEEDEYTLNVSGITDEAGNAVSTRDFSFPGSSQPDTTQQRIISVNGEEGLLQDDPFEVTFAAPITNSDISDSTVVIEGDVDFTDWPTLETERNIFTINPQGEWIEDVEYQFLVWNPKSQRRTLFEPQIWDSTEYGEIELTLENTDTTAAHIVNIFQGSGVLAKSDALYNSGIIENLPPLTYTLVIFRDENSNGQWDKGTVIPYRKPEPYYVQRNLNVREGFTSGVRISFE